MSGRVGIRTLESMLLVQTLLSSSLSVVKPVLLTPVQHCLPMDGGSIRSQFLVRLLSQRELQKFHKFLWEFGNGDARERLKLVYLNGIRSAKLVAHFNGIRCIRGFTCLAFNPLLFL